MRLCKNKFNQQCNVYLDSCKLEENLWIVEEVSMRGSTTPLKYDFIVMWCCRIQEGNNCPIRWLLLGSETYSFTLMLLSQIRRVVNIILKLKCIQDHNYIFESRIPNIEYWNLFSNPESRISNIGIYFRIPNPEYQILECTFESRIPNVEYNKSTAAVESRISNMKTQDFKIFGICLES